MKEKKKHKHYWSYEHMIYSDIDEKSSAVRVHRYCGCGFRQMARTGIWRKAPKVYDLTLL